MFRLRGSILYFIIFTSTLLFVFLITSVNKAAVVEDRKLNANAEELRRNLSPPQSQPQNEEKKNLTPVQSPNPTQTQTEIHTTTTKQNSLREILQCQDSKLETNVDYHGHYVIFKNFVKAKKQFKCHETITLTAPGDFRFLDNVVPLVDKWRGPISVALYAPGYDFHSTLRSIAYLRQCQSPLIKELVSFHLFFEHDYMPVQVTPLVDAYEDVYDCTQKPPYETMQDDQLYKSRNNLTYPINLARNIAKVNSQTHFVFPSDIELYPSRNFISKFLEFVKNNPEYIERETRNVFVLPIFEVVENAKVPETKTELQAMLKNNTAILFHQTVCALCHKVPLHDVWVKSRERPGLHAFATAKRHGRNALWEPFFVCTQKEPLWDERFNWEGQSNKMCQAYQMCMLDYSFIILDNAFLTHKPGVKKKKVQILKHFDQVKINNRLMEELSRELPKLYGSNKQCRVKYKR